MVQLDCLKVKFKSSEVKVIGQSSWSQDENVPFSVMDPRYDVT